MITLLSRVDGEYARTLIESHFPSHRLLLLKYSRERCRVSVIFWLLFVALPRGGDSFKHLQ